MDIENCADARKTAIEDPCGYWFDIMAPWLMDRHVVRSTALSKPNALVEMPEGEGSVDGITAQFRTAFDKRIYSLI